MDSRLIALSHLALDLDAPSTDWDSYLAGRGIAVVTDDLGRPAVTRGAARELISEHRKNQRENEARKARMREESERRAIEADQHFRASLNPGIPWYLIGRDVSPAAALLEAQQDADYAGRPRSVAAQLLENELAGVSSLEYHPIRDEQP